MKEYTQIQINKKYYNKYIEVSERFDWNKKEKMYQVLKTSNVICENMTLGQDIGTSMEYCR